MDPDLIHFGVTFHAAPPVLAERLSMDCDTRMALLRRLERFTQGRMVLSTCERFEVYAVTGVRDEQAWLPVLADRSGVSAHELVPFVRIHHGGFAADHLLRVAAGLESRILGEPQVLGQVRDAYVRASRLGQLDPVLSALGRAAIHTGKRVRNETTINRHDRSVVTLALDYLAGRSRPTQDRTVLVLGTGSLADDVAAALRDSGLGRLVFVGRNAPRVRALACRYGAEAFPMTNLAAVISESDVLISCTGARTHLVDASMIDPVRSRALDLIDLSVPANIDPAVGCLPRVSLTRLSDLLNGEHPRRDGVADAERIVQEELARLIQWQRKRRFAQQIANLTRHRPASVGGTSRERARSVHARIVELTAGSAA